MSVFNYIKQLYIYINPFLRDHTYTMCINLYICCICTYACYYPLQHSFNFHFPAFCTIYNHVYIYVTVHVTVHVTDSC